jgi:hypothetical protein
LTHGLRPGDWCALHWDWVCERLDRRRLTALRRYTGQQHAVVDSADRPGRRPGLSRPSAPARDGFGPPYVTLDSGHQRVRSGASVEEVPTEGGGVMSHASLSSLPTRIFMAVALVAVAAIAGWSVIAPSAQPASVPATTPSGVRAMEDLEVVAAQPHPVGSAAQHLVRDYLVAQGETLRLPTEVQRATVHGVAVENVIIRLPGAADTGLDVLITGHYDSATEAPGATDDGVPVVAMLEAMRALQAGDRLRNDVVFLFTDGEERSDADGGLGIKAFFAEHPDADRVAVAFAFECLPESSGVVLRSTTEGDAWLVSELRRASVPMFADSANNVSDRGWPHNDFAAFAPAGLVGAGFHGPGDRVRYHNAGDNVDAVDAGVVQDFADTMVRLGKHFGDLDLTRATASSRDHVFFTFPGLGLLDYPIWLARALAVAAAAGFVAVVVAARQRRHLRLGRAALGSAVWLCLCVVGLVVSSLVWRLLLALHPESDTTLNAADYEHASTHLLVIVLVAIAAYVAASQLLARWLGALELAAGAIVWSVLGALLFAFAVPLFSPVAGPMALGGVVALAVTVFADPRRWGPAILMAVAAAPGLVVMTPLLLLEIFDVEDGPTSAVPVFGLFIGTLLPQVLLVTGRLSGSRMDTSSTSEPAPVAATAAP